MAEFTPEYEALMRQLAMEHEFQPGDWMLEVITEAGDETRIWLVTRESMRIFPSAYPKYDGHGRPPIFWLPLEGDWLRMLEEAGARYIRLFDASRVAADRWPGWRAKAVIHDGPETQEITGAGTTILEALARLWMAVSGREA